MSMRMGRKDFFSFSIAFMAARASRAWFADLWYAESYSVGAAVITV
jgi:hypothetical protein